MWEIQPWDNDVAADWFSSIMDKSKLAVLVRKTLTLAVGETIDPEHSPKLRSAAYFLLHLGYVYVWPIEKLDDDLTLAIQALKVVLADQDYCYSTEMTNQVKTEIRLLEDRLNKYKINN
ncbi:hypothetical protein [Fibrella aquatilis]|uniref:Uncharacterized protein n=1 Tax=Fibrella aquatilis TaxID=2817059 RepID=A0A939G6X6_9BACT|nr:hypothetical protein [Fibrella aquatilis]MBO0933304.1 hypothetical protein [Fibrella aquatilis]